MGSYADSTFASPVAPTAPTTTTAPTGAQAAHCRSGGHPSAGHDADAGTVTHDGEASAFLCARCGATSPYQGRRPRHKGGNGCRECSGVVNAIYDAQMSVYRRIAADAYKPGVGGQVKVAILKRAMDESSAAWRAALASFGLPVPVAERQVAA